MHVDRIFIPSECGQNCGNECQSCDNGHCYTYPNVRLVGWTSVSCSNRETRQGQVTPTMPPFLVSLAPDCRTTFISTSHIPSWCPSNKKLFVMDRGKRPSIVHRHTGIAYATHIQYRRVWERAQGFHAASHICGVRLSAKTFSAQQLAPWLFFSIRA